jgi:hypothetical protein
VWLSAHELAKANRKGMLTQKVVRLPLVADKAKQGKAEMASWNGRGNVRPGEVEGVRCERRERCGQPSREAGASRGARSPYTVTQAVFVPSSEHLTRSWLLPVVLAFAKVAWLMHRFYTLSLACTSGSSSCPPIITSLSPIASSPTVNGHRNRFALTGMHACRSKRPIKGGQDSFSHAFRLVPGLEEASVFCVRGHG